ncbi:hypothetical protein [Nocardiopsis tropica]|uniref:Uncharacterized protein n=1 Tax=Nocardiopsis tropica TaxID=109330 RepID=A0ABU7KHX8_9ACTN|nr:hypothetical protein [Nocardiopsis umidischolae]MEE2048906.1 hypothetical protein [Nocardiopsis umidischolae]
MVLFVNGPIQNGSFTFRDRPGKAVGLRLAETLNGILDHPRAPHLWNTVTLEGDLRHGRGLAPAERAQRERLALLDKYAPGLPSPPEVLTDTDPAVAALALDMIEAGLSQGSLRIERTAVRECTDCGHMIGPVSARCTACGGERLRTTRTRHLVHHLAEKDVSLAGLLHNHHRRPARHLEAILGQAPRRLLLSRTRAHGIGLDALGLEGVDPRTGLHVTVLAAVRSAGGTLAAMTATAHSIGHIAAHGIGFNSWREHRLRYAVHGLLPYEALSAIGKVYAFHRVTRRERLAFESRFLPLFA